MNFVDFRRQVRRSTNELARTQPRTAFMLELGRYAAIMALALVVTDVTPLALHAGTPWRRLAFIGVWSLLMALTTRTPLRAREEPDSSPQSVI